MRSVNAIVSKSKAVIKEEGFLGYIKRLAYFLRNKIFHTESVRPNQVFMDVLFINGCTLSHPTRYRVEHQVEQLAAGGLTSRVIESQSLTMELIKNFRVFIFFRCPITDTVRDFITMAKKYNKRVIFDIDDLVIDEKYTKTIKHLDTMSAEERALYDDGVNRIRQTLLMCDSAITTTKRLKDELLNYVPSVYVNRNVASNEMVMLSNKALLEVTHDNSKVKIGYFSGSITHNADFELILPILIKLMEEFPNLELHLIGEISLPDALTPFKDRVVFRGFVDYKELPSLIASVDINLAPLEDSIFNEAKSENKWTEASLVKVITVASNVGAMKDIIKNGETGFLCSNSEEWYVCLKLLIAKKAVRHQIANNAYDYVSKNCVTIYTGKKFADYIKSQMTKNIAFVVPSTNVSGGILVVMKHALILRKQGYDILVINEDDKDDNVLLNGEEIFCLSNKKVVCHGRIDKMVATLWATLDYVEIYKNAIEKYYFVQNFETNFYDDGEYLKVMANATYCCNDNINMITISKWCQQWLLDDFGKESAYAPNGIDISRFKAVPRDFSKGKIRILVEGNSEDYYKNVDESFKIINKLDKEKFEVWYMSYKGEPKEWYRVDRFFHKIPYDNVPSIYEKCDILIKSSMLESFSYPPIEMMATGGIAVVAPNEGNIEYLVDNENCMLYKRGDLDAAVNAINEICKNAELRKTLIEGGINTAKSRDWNSIEEQVLELYNY
ncbi:MAG: glycosyltransferase [Clostridia bacterium]